MALDDENVPQIVDILAVWFVMWWDKYNSQMLDNFEWMAV